jgi:hypothetical protein
MKDDAMSHGHIVPDCQRTDFSGDVQDREILNVRSCADPDPVNVSPDDGGKPDAGFGTDLNVPDHLGGFGDPDGRIDLREIALVGENHKTTFRMTV